MWARFAYLRTANKRLADATTEYSVPVYRPVYANASSTLEREASGLEFTV